jgi:hypothetical protein
VEYVKKKGDDFDENLLKPDDEDYDFDKYFDIRWDTGELIPNSDASYADQTRAKNNDTIIPVK